MVRILPPCSIVQPTRRWSSDKQIALPASVQEELLILHNNNDGSLHSQSAPERQLRQLTRLQRYQLAYVPFENLLLHYSPHRTLSLDKGDLYGKIVKRSGAGFTVHSIGASVRHSKDAMSEGGYLGWGHMVNLVTLSDGRKCVVDVGFGDDPTQPLPLVIGDVWPVFGRQQMGLSHKNIGPDTDPGERLWIYQSRKLETDE
ncbi:DUF1279 super [Lobaria immixta]|nr:DUF1279 super [Lobaria immixta]